MSLLSSSREFNKCEKFLFSVSLIVCFFTGFVYLSNPKTLILCLIISGTSGFIFGLFYGRKSRLDLVLHPISFAVGGIIFMISTAFYFSLRGGTIQTFELVIPFFITAFFVLMIDFCMRKLIQKFTSIHR